MADNIAGFPMVMSVSDKAINAQLNRVYGQSTHEKEMFPHVPWNFGPDDLSWGVSVEEFEAPQVDFDTDIKGGCRLLMTIKRGQYTSDTIKRYKDKDGKIHKKIESVSLELGNMTIAVTTPMRQIKHPTWSDENFEVQALFADLENVHRVDVDLSKNPKVAHSGSIKADLETLFKDQIEALGEKYPAGSEGALLFGAVKKPLIPKAAQSSGPLKPSASTYSTFRSPQAPAPYKEGELEYMLLIDDDTTFPTGGTVGVMDKSLLLTDKKATLVVSDTILLEKVMKPLLEKAYPKIKLKVEPGDMFAGRKAKLHLTESYEFGMDINDHSRTAHLTKADVVIDGNKFRMDYHIDTSVYQAVKDLDATIDGYQEIILTDKGGTFDIKINAPEPDHHVDDPPLGLRILFDILTVGFNELALKLSTDSAGDDMDNDAQKMLTDTKLALTSFLLPGKAVWNYDTSVLDGHLYVAANYE
ncbi:MAG: hypothetical protein AAF423_09090 [Pseudomonadota bacterium]